jgi:hypothetical protein
LGLSKHVITIIKQLSKTLVLVMQEGKLITYLILGVGVQVAVVTLLADGARSHTT